MAYPSIIEAGKGGKLSSAKISSARTLPIATSTKINQRRLHFSYIPALDELTTKTTEESYDDAQF